MKVMIAHNRYQQSGGEDSVVDTEISQLEKSGVEIVRFFVDNDSIINVRSKTAAALQVRHNVNAVQKINQLLDASQPDLVHFHNTFPTMSPASIEAVIKREIPVVQTLHNYRVMCANAQFLRNGRPCTACVSGSRMNGIINKCYRDSTFGSIAATISGSATKKIYESNPSLYTIVALTEFFKKILIKAGFEPNRILIKGNSTADIGASKEKRNGRLLYVGRLSDEKGVNLLLDISQKLNTEIDIVGDGPLAPIFEGQVKNIRMHGWLPREQVYPIMKSSSALLVPSKWYEGFPVVILEAFSAATPVIASEIGSLPDIVKHEVTGFIVGPSDELGWIHYANMVSESRISSELGANARNAYLANYSPEINSRKLIDIYEGAIARANI